jgi:hypothetical protein
LHAVPRYGLTAEGMERDEVSSGGAWVPQSCTLPASGRQLRAAEFGGLFTEMVLGIERAAPTRLRLDLAPSPQAAGRAAELAAAETGCCSFFTFTLTAAAGRLVLEIAVPAPHITVLDALAAHAATAAGTGHERLA